MEACEHIKSTFQRTARACSETDFLEIFVRVEIDMCVCVCSVGACLFVVCVRRRSSSMYTNTHMLLSHMNMLADL